jgi:tetratricopeptide (TPR) repeat protein
MGGLVLKHWFINYYDKKIGCNYNDGTWLDVRRVFFIGTPHYGAPKALTALFEGYSLYDGNWFVNKYVSEGLNSYGFSFDSLYELLPVQNDEACNSVYGAGSGLPSAFSDTPNASDYAKIFNIDFMTAHDLPYSPLTAQKKEFREKRLDAILKKAAKFACDLAEYKFPILGLGNVTVIVGHGVTDELNNNTAAALTKTGGRWTPVRANGDGTVLRSSAEWKNIIVDDRNVEYSGSDHMELMDQPEVRLKIYRAVHAVSDGVFRAVQGDAAKFARALAMLNQQKKLFFPVPGDQASVQFANEINSRLFSLRGMTTDEVLKAASDARKGTKTDSALSYVFIEYASVPANANPIGDFFANQAAGKELLDLGYKDDALKAFSKAIETSPNVLEQAKSSNLSKELIKSLELTTSNAYNNRATIYLNEWKLDKARPDLDAAIKLGNVRAKEGLQILERLQLQ